MSETDLFRNGNCTYDFSGVLIKYGDMVFNKIKKCQKGCLRLVLNTIGYIGKFLHTYICLRYSVQ